MLVEVEQNDGVCFFTEEGVVVGVIPGGKRDHQFQADSMQRRPDLSDEVLVIVLVGRGNFFEVDDDAFLLGEHGIGDHIVDQAMARGGMCQ